MIDLREDQMKVVRRVLADHVPECEVRAFGSRVAWTASDSSDLDLALVGKKKLDWRTVAKIKRAFEESDLPFRVDVLDWNAIPESFRKNILKKYEVIQPTGEADHVPGEAADETSLYRPRFPAEWDWHSLRDLADWINGLAFRNVHFSPTGKPIVKIAEIKNGLSGQTKYTEAEYDERYRLIPGDMLFSWSGQPETSIDAAWWRGPEGWLNQHIFKVLPKDTCDRTFFYYLLKYLKPHFIRIAHNKQTTGLGHVTKTDLQRMEVAVPKTKKEQKAIAHILGTLDDKIELNRRMNETLEGIARAIFKSWFVDFDPVRAKAEGRDSGLPKEIADLFPDGFEPACRDGHGAGRDSELGEIPKGWKAVTANEILDVNPRVPLSKGTIAPYVDMKALPIAGFSVTDVIKKEFKGGSKFQQGDVLLARITPCLENGKTGLVDFLSEGEVGFGSTEFIVLRGRSGISTEFVYCLARNECFRQHCVASMVGSSGRQRVQTACFDQFIFAKAPDALLMEFARRARASFGKISDNSSELAMLTSLRDNLLSGLLSGAVPVPLHKGATA